MSTLDLTKLRDPFPASAIEWRIGQAGKKKDGTIWAKCLAYLTSRAIMDRLDDICGPDGWQVDYREADSHLMAGIGILTPENGWVWKWDGTGRLASNDGLSATDAGKGDFSNAMKRAAVQWGMGRYLYDLPEGWATVRDAGRFYGRLPQNKGGDSFHWDPPELPAWAVPEGGLVAQETLDELAALITGAESLGGLKPEGLEKCRQALAAQTRPEVEASVEWLTKQINLKHREQAA